MADFKDQALGMNQIDCILLIPVLGQLVPSFGRRNGHQAQVARSPKHRHALHYRLGHGCPISSEQFCLRIEGLFELALSKIDVQEIGSFSLPNR